MSLLDIIFPKRCLGCGRIGYYFCHQCSSIVRTIELNEMICPVCEKPAVDGVTHPGCRGKYTIDGLTSIFRYDGVVRKAIKSLKYRFTTDMTREFTGLIPLTSYNFIKDKSNHRTTLIIPIPLHIRRKRDRGFNQAELLGSYISANLGIMMRNNLLIRTRLTTPQVEMKNRRDRLNNMNGVFKVAGDLPDHDIILFDDVFTTGATMRAAAASLKHAGAEFVWGVTIAR